MQLSEKQFGNSSKHKTFIIWPDNSTPKSTQVNENLSPQIDLHRHAHHSKKKKMEKSSNAHQLISH